MPLIRESSEEVFLEDAHLQHPRLHHGFFLRAWPYRGEPLTKAGFLLYPNTPVRMETTSREAFCFRPHPDRGKGHSDTQPRQTQRGVSSTEDKRQQRDDHPTSPAGNKQQEAAEMKTQYQQDFPPPPSCCRRSTPALPQPDNLGINPAFRLEFSTAQREAFPGLPTVEPSRPGRIETTEPEPPTARLRVPSR